MPGHDILFLSLFGACILISAFFSSSETAFFSLQRVRLKTLVDSGVNGADLVDRLVSQPAKLLSTILLGNNLVNVAAASLATILAINYLGENQGVLAATIITTVLLLIFSETVPKTIATHNAEKLSLAYVRPLILISWILAPVVIVLSWIASLFSRIFGAGSISGTLFSVDEMRTMISAGQQEGFVEEPDARMLNKVFDFSDQMVREVMVPRTEVIGIELGSTYADFVSLFSISPRSRFPVFNESMDCIEGILVTKDVYMAYNQGKLEDNTKIDTIMRPAYFAPETKPVNQLFHDMKNSNAQMAILVDEYGGTAGIISLVGLVEEIVGEMGDELTSTDEEIRTINEHTWQIDGAARIADINYDLEIVLPESEDYDTMAGFVLSIFKHIPKENELIRFEGLRIEIMEMQGFKIKTVKITKEMADGTEQG